MTTPQAEQHWRSPIDIPRDGSVIAVLHKERWGIVVTALWFGVSRWETEVDGVLKVVSEDAWCMLEDSEVYADAKDFDDTIVGWLPLPQIAAWKAPHQ